MVNVFQLVIIQSFYSVGKGFIYDNYIMVYF